MKNSISALLIAIAIICSSLSLRAQSTNVTSGIYLTEQDYKTNKLSYQLGENDKMRLNDFLGGKNVTLVYHGAKIKLSKNDIYGYRLQNQNFRFYDNEAYRILDTAGFMLYSHPILTHQGKGNVPVNHYYYSINNVKPVLELTVENLEKSFAGQTGFRYSLQNYNGDLAAYDTESHQYKIKYLYFQQKEVSAHAK
jgi:hypothetical protein